MIALGAAAPSVLASFLASTVEFVEALTVVLAVGVTRGWRSALLGSGAALLVLVLLASLLGPLLTLIPLAWLQLVVGTLLLLFGLRWLRKAILRGAGVLALHDETAAYAQQTAALRAHDRAGQSLDRLAFSTAFNIVMLEGMEVVFIVIAIGAGGQMLLPAAAGALLALLMVVLLGLALHRPLARVPENALKFGVGVLLGAFGTFWVGEGIGLAWPAADSMLPALVAIFLFVALALVPICAGRHRRRAAPPVARTSKVAASANPTPLAAIGTALSGLLIDDGWLAGGIVLWVMLAWGAGIGHWLANDTLAACFVAGLLLLLAHSAVRRAGR